MGDTLGPAIVTNSERACLRNVTLSCISHARTAKNPMCKLWKMLSAKALSAGDLMTMMMMMMMTR